VACGYDLQARKEAGLSTSFLREYGEIMLVKGAPAMTLILLVQVAILVVVSGLPFLPGEESVFVQAQQQQAQVLAAAGPLEEFVQILANNFMVGLREMVPGFGVLWFGIVSYDTARIVEAIAISQSLSPFEVSTFLILLPHTWIELLGYSFALYQGAYITTSLFRQRGGRALVLTRFFLLEVAFSFVVLALILFTAAAFEVGEILVGIYAFLAWIPFGALVFFYFRMRSAVVGGRTTPRDSAGLATPPPDGSGKAA
jgi:hypothetical protein